MAINTNVLKRFAQEARKKLMDQIEAKLDFVLHQDSATLREKAKLLTTIKTEIKQNGKEALIDKVAYTWFNRLVALRFMDANDYQPSGYKIISPITGQVSPQILQEAHAGLIPEDLSVDRQKVLDLLDGKLQVNNPDNEAFRLLLIAACNQLHRIFPFLFERIDDYTELLVPDDLTSAFSIITDIVNGMPDEACEEVEVIGWLYQFYISERKDEVFASKKKVEKEDIPAATQLFTPRWIVEYMVQNTVGKLWLQNKPQSKLKDYMPYYIDSPSGQADEFLKIDSVEELTLLDQACGSGHILVYGFELLSKIYEEEGYSINQIPKLILENNLFGYEIDQRAAQLAGFALMMKARAYHRRFFSSPTSVNILCYEDLRIEEEDIKIALKQMNVNLSENLFSDLKNIQQATNLGSLLIPQTSLPELEKVANAVSSYKNTTDLFVKNQVDQLTKALEQLIALSRKFHCVVDNPPYMGGGAMNKELADYVRVYYPESKADLMACFMEAGLNSLKPKGFLGMINQHSWMFLSSYEKLRESLIKEVFFDTLLHLGPRTFPEIGGEVVQNVAFTFWNIEYDAKGKYIRLVDYKNAGLKKLKTIETIQNSECGGSYVANQKDFEKIPGNPIGYWLSANFIKLFEKNKTLKELGEVRGGMTSANNSLFLRFWTEVPYRTMGVGFSKEGANMSVKKWFPYNKGGADRKWYGNLEYVINWFSDGKDIKDYKLEQQKTNPKYNIAIAALSRIFQSHISWSFISSKLNIRYYPQGLLFDVSGSSIFLHDRYKEKEVYIMSLLNTKISDRLMEVLNPTINIQPGNVANLPFINHEESKIYSVGKLNINISRQEWNLRETAWDFEQNELIRINEKGDLGLEETVDLFKLYWTNKFQQLHKNEEELNKDFIEIYGLNEELSPDVKMEDITILKTELNQRELKKISDFYQSGWELKDGKWILEKQREYPVLPFDAKEIMIQFISYAVGCMFGRYSLDKEGLILANQGETLQEYLEKVGLSEESLRFIPDTDNIIPVLDDEWFEDDIVGKFNEFLRTSFGEQNYHKNRAFIEEALGKNIRAFFIRDFYDDHSKRYKKRPIYWQFSSPKKCFMVMIYMHRYNQDTLNKVLNDYLRPFMERVAAHQNQLKHSKLQGSASEQARIEKEIDRLQAILEDCQKYESETLFPLASERIPIDLDDGVLVNYNKFGDAIAPIAGLNDKKAKDKVKKFDWIDTSSIR